MKIGELDMHCGNCGVIDYCTEPYEAPGLCCIEGLEDVEEEEYIRLAESLTADELDDKREQYEENGTGWTDEWKGAFCDLVLEKLYS
jgi:hypothetical protein